MQQQQQQQQQQPFGYSSSSLGVPGSCLDNNNAIFMPSFGYTFGLSSFSHSMGVSPFAAMAQAQQQMQMQIQRQQQQQMMMLQAQMMMQQQAPVMMMQLQQQQQQQPCYHPVPTPFGQHSAHPQIMPPISNSGNYHQHHQSSSSAKRPAPSATDNGDVNRVKRQRQSVSASFTQRLATQSLPPISNDGNNNNNHQSSSSSTRWPTPSTTNNDNKNGNDNRVKSQRQSVSAPFGQCLATQSSPPVSNDGKHHHHHDSSSSSSTTRRSTPSTTKNDSKNGNDNRVKTQRQSVFAPFARCLEAKSSPPISHSGNPYRHSFSSAEQPTPSTRNVDNKNGNDIRVEHQRQQHPLSNSMQELITDKAFSFVEQVLQAVVRVKRQTRFSSNLASKTSAVAEDDLFYLAKQMMFLQESFRAAGKSVQVDIGYHFTRPENMAKIRTVGLLTKQERELLSSHAIQNNGSILGDGVYTADDPCLIGPQRNYKYGTIGLLVARLVGREGPPTAAAATVGSSSSRSQVAMAGRRSIGSAVDTTTHQVSGLGLVRVLHSSSQCLALVQFDGPSVLGRAKTKTRDKINLSMVKAYQETLQKSR